MMSQPFNISSARPSPPQDFMMMNNNYLPGISRLNGTAHLPFPSDVSNTHPMTIMTNVQRHLPAHPAPVQDCPIDTERISMNIKDCFSGGNQHGSTGAELCPTIHGSMSSQVAIEGMETKMPNLCEHQGSALAQNTNISQNSGWSNVYNTGSLDQCCTSNFTFTTPTQSYLYSPALTATTQNRFQYSRMRPQTFAPGCSTPWQHSAPKRLSSLRQRSFSSPQPISIFTGSQSSSVSSMSQPENNLCATNTYYSPQMRQPVASCSESIRRTKRRHTVDTADDFGPNNKIYLTEEKIANHMKELRIHNFSPPPDTSIPAGEHYVDTGQGMIPMSDSCYPQQTQSNGCSPEMLKHSQRQWHDFKLLEERLEMIDEDSDADDSSKSEPVLRIAEGIEIQPQSVIPQDILDKICNPCREVVLWSPPNAAVKKMVASDEVIRNNFGCDPGDMMEDLVSGNTQSEPETVADDSGMETEPIEDMLEL